MAFVSALKCRECGREYPIEPSYTCSWCFGPLEVAYDYDAIRGAISRDSIQRGPTTLWRYAELLPCDPEYKVDLGTGFTPLIKADRLARTVERVRQALAAPATAPDAALASALQRLIGATPAPGQA
mgnify:CR=1 FL=1